MEMTIVVKWHEKYYFDLESKIDEFKHGDYYYTTFSEEDFCSIIEFIFKEIQDAHNTKQKAFLNPEGKTSKSYVSEKIKFYKFYDKQETFFKDMMKTFVQDSIVNSDFFYGVSRFA